MKFLMMILICMTLCFPAFAKATHSDFVIDTDVGIDDAIAMLYFLNQPDIKIKAITIEADGDAHCHAAFQNTKSLLKLTHHANIPVACGPTIPLRGRHHFPKYILRQSDSLAHTVLPNTHAPFPPYTAKELLTNTLKKSQHPINILAIGPLTNLAEVITQHPLLRKKIKRIYIMGGAIHVPGNIYATDKTLRNRISEWNIYIDPYAAQKVFSSNIPITLVPLDVTNKVLIDEKFYSALKYHHTTPAAKFVFKLLTHNQDMIKKKEWYFWDPMAAVIAHHPSLATIKMMPIKIKLHPESQSGATAIDHASGTPIDVCTDIDIKNFKYNLLNGLESTSCCL